MRELDVNLPDGRHLRGLESGPQHGQVVLLFHGAPNSRYFLPPEAGRDYRIVTFDRPGYGGSSPASHQRRVADVGGDVVHLMDALSIDRAVAVGVSAGGPYALASAAALPNRIAGVALVSSIGPIERREATRDMNRTNRLAFTIARFLPFLLRPAISGMAREARVAPEALLDQSGSDFSTPDRQAMQRPDLREMYLRDLPEAYAQGAVGHASDLCRLARPWGFRMSDVGVPVTIWQGGQDQNVPPRMAEELAAELPDAKIRREPQLGHLLLFSKWKQIVEDICSRSDDQPALKEVASS